jgi:hypothetical protein
MKNIVFILLFIASGPILACSCVTTKLLYKVENSDFIARAKILKVTPDPNDERKHDLEIEILELFKGEEVKSIKIFSFLKSSCAIYAPEGSTWLIFARTNADGINIFGACSGSRQLDRKIDEKRYPNASRNFKKSIDFKQEVLRYLRDNDIEVTNNNKLRLNLSNKCLREIADVPFEKREFGLYEVEINEDLGIGKITPLKEFANEKLKNELPQCLKSGLYATKRKRKEEVEGNFTMILAVYMYKKEDVQEAFLSLYSL